MNHSPEDIRDDVRGTVRETMRQAIRETIHDDVRVTTLRPALESDVPAIAAIEKHAFSDPWPESAFLDFLARAHARITVAADESGGVLGYCVLLIMADEAEVANIAVAPEARNRGIAGQLLDESIEHARARGVSAIYLEVRTSNAPARALYASRGFRQLGRRRGYYSQPVEDALVMRWGVA